MTNFSLLFGALLLVSVSTAAAFEPSCTSSSHSDEALCSQWVFNDVKESSIFSCAFDVQDAAVSTVDGVDYMEVSTTGIPGYFHRMDAQDIAILDSRPNASTDFKSGAATVSEGDWVEFGEDIGYGSNGCELGYWPPGPACAAEQDRVELFPLYPQESNATCYTTLGTIGMWKNGVSVYNWWDSSSYESEDVWHVLANDGEFYDMDICNGHSSMEGNYHHHGYPNCLAEQLFDNGAGASPIFGFAADGFPILGPYVSAGVVAQSCWQKRDYDTLYSSTGCSTTGERSCTLKNNMDVSEGTVDTAYAGPTTDTIMTTQSGNQIMAASGYFYEDYYFNSTCASKGTEYLDEKNGRYVDWLDSYAYHVTVNFLDDGTFENVFPHIIGPSFHGLIDSQTIVSCSSEIFANGAGGGAGGAGGAPSQQGPPPQGPAPPQQGPAPTQQGPAPTQQGPAPSQQGPASQGSSSLLESLPIGHGIMDQLIPFFTGQSGSDASSDDQLTPPQDGQQPQDGQGPPPQDGQQNDQGPPPQDGQGPPPQDGEEPLQDGQGPPQDGQHDDQGPPPQGGQGPPPQDGQGPPPQEGEEPTESARGILEDDETTTEQDGQRPPHGHGPPHDGEEPSQDGQGPPPQDGQGPPPRDGEEPTVSARGILEDDETAKGKDGQRPHHGQGPPPQDGEEPTQDSQGPPHQGGQGPPPQDGEEPTQDGQGPPPPNGEELAESARGILEDDETTIEQDGQRPPHAHGPPHDGEEPSQDGQGPPPQDGQGPPPQDGQGPPPQEGEEPTERARGILEDDETATEQDGQRPPHGHGPPQDGEEPTQDGQGPPPQDGQGPPPQDGEEPTQDGQRPPHGQGPPQDGDAPAESS